MEQVQRAYGVMAEQYIELICSTHVHADDLALIARARSIVPPDDPRHPEQPIQPSLAAAGRQGLNDRHWPGHAP